MTVYVANIVEIFFWFNTRILLQSTTIIAKSYLNLGQLYTLATNYINHVLDTFVIPVAQTILIPYHVVAALVSLFHLVILQPLQASLAPKVARNENGTRAPAAKRVASLSPNLSTFRCWQGKAEANTAPMTPFQSRRPQLRIDTEAAEATVGLRRRRAAPLHIEPTPAPAPVSVPLSSTSSRKDEGYESLSNHSSDEIDIVALSFEPFDYEAAAQAERKKRSPKHRRLHPQRKLFTGRLPVGINAEQRDHLMSKALVAVC